jgi:TRAP-type C4-dicarboxylate transport system permease small subunit
MTQEHGASHTHHHVPLVLRPLRALDGALRKGELVVLVSVLVTMIGLSFAQVVLRKVRPYVPWIQDVAWFDILARHLVLWAGILGASIAAREGRHFGVELLPKLFSERTKQRFEAVLNVVAGGVTVLLAAGMLDYVRRPEVNAAFRIEALNLPVQRSWLLAIMPVGLALMAYRFLLRSLEALLLTGPQWHALERELKPDVTAPAPGDEAASLGSGAVVESATPPSVQEAQEKAGFDAAEAAFEGGPRVAPARHIEKSTDEIRIRRLGDLGDVIDPRPEAGSQAPVDPDVALVDSDMTTAGPQIDEPEPNAATERQQPLPPPNAGPDREKGGRS